MKKIFFTVILIFLLAVPAFCADYYFVGVDAFNKGAYDKALPNLEHAVKINPNNVNARYYLAQVYLKLNRIPEAKTQYNRIIFLAPDSDAGILSQKGLSIIMQAYSKNSTLASIDELARYKDNYIDYVVNSKGEINKWKSFPLAIYVEPKPQAETVKKAFEQWQAKSGKLISYNFVTSPEKAQIKVEFKDKLESTSTKEGFFAGFSKPTYVGKYLSGSDIQILTVDPQTKEEFNNNNIYSTALHEIGHSLGFSGHSPNAKDVMFAYSTDPKLELTQRDINTLNVFYRVDEKTLLARKTGQTDVKLQQAIEYANKNANKSIGWINLGDIYFSKKMYTEAIRNYQKAISAEPDRASGYYSLGTAYRFSGEKQKAYINIKKACDLDNTNSNYIRQFAAICSELNKREDARKYIQAYIKANPDKASDANVKKLLNY